MSAIGFACGFVPFNRTTPVMVPPSLASIPPTFNDFAAAAAALFGGSCACTRPTTTNPDMTAAITARNRYCFMTLLVCRSYFLSSGAVFAPLATLSSKG